MSSLEDVRSLARDGAGQAALELAAAEWRTWLAAGDLGEGRAMLAEALDAPGADGPTAARARALYADGLLAFRQGDQEGSRGRNREALAVARAGGDARGESNALVGLSRVAFRLGNEHAAKGGFRERREALAGTDEPYELGMEALNGAALAWSAGDHEQAAGLLDEAEATLSHAGIGLDPDDAFELAWLRERVAS